VERINSVWHKANPMPKNPSPVQRIEWHMAHAHNCMCRGIPKGVLKLMEERGISLPEGYDISRK